MCVSYSLRLASGQEWYLTATNDTLSWLQKLASSMRLSLCDKSEVPNLIFVRSSSFEKLGSPPLEYIDNFISPALPDRGWIHHFIGEKDSFFQFWTHPDSLHFICDIGAEGGHYKDISMSWRTLLLIYEHEIMSGGIPVHTAFIGCDKAGVILPAEGNTGKSTCCFRVPSPWRCMCDDEALIVADRYGNYMAHPFPTWSEFFSNEFQKSWDVQQYLSLRAIFFLEQSSIDVATKINYGQAAVLITKLSAPILTHNWRSMDKDKRNVHKQKLIDNAFKIAKSVPAFKLKFTKDGQFWKEIEKTLEKIQ